jgi:hypothetical protein
MTVSHRLISERKGAGRLGRHVHFDERSRKFAARNLHAGTAIATRLWARRIAPFDQGDLGSCTGNGAVGLLATAPFRKAGEVVNEKLAVAIYSKATALDPYPGTYPPTDTGSSVLASMKALQQAGKIKSYHWCFGLTDVLTALSNLGPVSIGIDWHSGFDNPDATGLVKLKGAVRGGHCFDLLGIDATAKTVTAINSWGSGWGLKGRFRFSWTDLDTLLQADGEAATVVR